MASTTVEKTYRPSSDKAPLLPSKKQDDEQYDGYNDASVSIVYLIIIADVLSGSTSSSVHHNGVLEEWSGAQTWWNSRVSVMLFTTLFILAPLTAFRHVDSLQLSSALSVALAILFVVVTAAIAVYKLVAGTIITAYICHHSVHPVLNELQDDTQSKMAILFGLDMLFTLCWCTHYSIFLSTLTLMDSSFQGLYFRSLCGFRLPWNPRLERCRWDCEQARKAGSLVHGYSCSGDASLKFFDTMRKAWGKHENIHRSADGPQVPYWREFCKCSNSSLSSFCKLCRLPYQKAIFFFHM
ncbi:hypothetical protein GOP47_0000821 [Adiantum capillus-veneris]|uniref:Amino acid transporter transmembrane domain-containing protein n=1 Tax=Adiantum capillus-veneris TaxID=13818 RepID=A0A9D4ZTA4_ADICA|nr:hypothetical protein GOP47_0000821 [Adiantum capillus-veneris]